VRGNVDAVVDPDIGQPDPGSRRPVRQRGKPDSQSDHVASTPGAAGVPDSGAAVSRNQRNNRRQAMPAGQDIPLPLHVVVSDSPDPEPPAGLQSSLPLTPAAVAVPGVVTPGLEQSPISPVVHPKPLPKIVSSTPVLQEAPVHQGAVHPNIQLPVVQAASLSHVGADPTWGLPAGARGASHSSGFDAWGGMYSQQLQREGQSLNSSLEIGVAPRHISDTGESGLHGMDRLQGRPTSAESSEGFDISRPKYDLGLSKFTPGNQGSSLPQHSLGGLNLPAANVSQSAPLQPSHSAMGFSGAFGFAPPLQHTATSMPQAISQVWSNRPAQQPQHQARPVVPIGHQAPVNQAPRVSVMGYNLSSLQGFQGLGGSSGGPNQVLGPPTQQPPPPPPPQQPAPTQHQTQSFSFPSTFGNATNPTSTSSLPFSGWPTTNQPQGSGPFVPTGLPPDWSSTGSSLGPGPTPPPPGLHVNIDSIVGRASVGVSGLQGPPAAPPGLSVR
jgi:hypothetical protein